LLGPPGAGKGTQAKALAKKLSLPHISTGDILRQNVKNKTALGMKAKEFMDKGELVLDVLVNQMLIERLKAGDVQAGFILDGYPRNLSQAQILDGILNKDGNNVFVIYLYASEPVIVQRLSGRRVCGNCQAVFHVTNMPPKKDLLCDYCAGELHQRTDDREETIKRRLKVYLDETDSLLQFYEKKNKLFRVCADEDADFVLNIMLDLVRQE
jgi:adenylate kinase